jgi:hypothetical protein
MHRASVSLRLPSNLLERLRRPAEVGRVSVIQLVTVAEKIERLDAGAFYRVGEGRSEAGAGWERMRRLSPSVELHDA